MNIFKNEHPILGILYKIIIIACIGSILVYNPITCIILVVTVILSTNHFYNQDDWYWKGNKD